MIDVEPGGARIQEVAETLWVGKRGHRNEVASSPLSCAGRKKKRVKFREILAANAVVCHGLDDLGLRLTIVEQVGLRVGAATRLARDLSKQILRSQLATQVRGNPIEPSVRDLWR